MSRIPSAQFQQEFGTSKRSALTEPLTITIHGKDTLVLMSIEHYRGLLAAAEGPAEARRE